MDYRECLEILEDKRAYTEKYPFARGADPDRKKLKHVTYLHRDYDDPDVFVIELFGKDIMFYHSDGSIVLDSCGWQTVTTKQRFNQYLPGKWGVHQRDSIWYVSWSKSHYDDNGKWVYDSDEWLFANGVRLLPDGAVEGDGGNVEELRELNKKLTAYVRNYVNALFAGKVPAPSRGDCWYCLMRDAKTDQTLGDWANDQEHLRSHIEERYYVPILLANAVEEYPISRVARWTVGALWYPEETGDFEISGWEDLVKNQLRSSLRRYMRRRLGLAA